MQKQQINRQNKEQLKNNIQYQKQGFEDKVKKEADYTKQEKREQKELLNMQKQQEYLKNSSLKQMIKT